MAPNVTMPDMPLTGGCQCGAIRYRIGAPPVAFYVCHCTACQRQSGSAFGESLLCVAAEMQVTGPPADFGLRGDSGQEKRCVFCPDCGTRLWHQGPGSPVRSVKAGTLDDRSWLAPVAHIWTASRQPWVTIPADAATWERQPDMARIRALWDEAVGRGLSQARRRHSVRRS